MIEGCDPLDGYFGSTREVYSRPRSRQFKLDYDIRLRCSSRSYVGKTWLEMEREKTEGEYRGT